MKIRQLIGMMMVFLVMPWTSAVPPHPVGCDNQQMVCPPQFPNETLNIDVVFVVDSTGSMADEIRSVKTEIINIIDEVESGQPSPELRVGVVAYRDHKPEEREYVTDKFSLTSDIEDAFDFIKDLEARGGGDLPEAVADGLHVAIHDMRWNRNAKKLIILIGDAAPHGVGSADSSFVQGCPDGHHYRDEIESANDKDITIYTVSGSGMDNVGVRVWKEIAKKTGGDYEKLTYLRRDVDQYYEAEGIDSRWVAKAKIDRDYDRATNSIMTNSLGGFAKASLMREASDMGVIYNDKSLLESGAEPMQDDSVSSFLNKVIDRLKFCD